jgi:hypothetical protein
MVRIGLIGEDPNDTSSISNLLLQKYRGRILFFPLAKGIRGFQLNNPKIRRSLPIEFADKKCKFVLYIRDVDGFKSDQLKVKAVQRWFTELDSTINRTGILLNNIWELEALILADITTFNKLYGTTYNFKGDPVTIKEPKELLKQITRKQKKQYKESHCPEIFEVLNFQTVVSRCSYFKDFIENFEAKL